MKDEPEIPEDGICVNDGCTNELKKIERYGAGFEDAFCSSTCCKAFFETETSIVVSGSGVRTPS